MNMIIPPARCSWNVVGEVETLTSRIEWRINHFNRICRKTQVGEVVQSPNFKVNSGSVQWHLELFPRGLRAEYKDFLSIYLHTESEERLEAIVNFNILNDRRQVVITQDLKQADYSQADYGTHKLASVKFITEPANYLTARFGALIIVCEITPCYHLKELEHIKEEDEKEAASESGLGVLDIYQDLLHDSKFSDVTLVSESNTIKAHKCILGKSSSVFASLFDVGEKRNVITVELNDIAYNVLEEMVHFIYTGKVNDIKKIVGELAIAAKKYALHRLVIFCENTMIDNISISNAINCLLVADICKMHKLKMKGIKFVVSNGSDVIDQPMFKKLPFDIVLKVCSNLAKKFNK